VNKLKGEKMQTIQLEIKNDNLAKKILSILDVFKDDGVFVKSVTKEDDIQSKKEEFANDIKQAFYELKNNQGKQTGKFVEIEIEK
jgi:hypothetical protein